MIAGEGQKGSIFGGPLLPTTASPQPASSFKTSRKQITYLLTLLLACFLQIFMVSSVEVQDLQTVPGFSFYFPAEQTLEKGIGKECFCDFLGLLIVMGAILTGS